MSVSRTQNLQPIAWFWDLYNQDRLDLDPPYQRRSVWNRRYKADFVDTILLDFPAPAVFLYEELSDTGFAKYSVVDGKQRLTTIFEFVQDLFPVADHAEAAEYRDKYFRDFNADQKRRFWSYRLLVEYLPSNDDSLINNVFNRINKNVAKLSPQELRHARYNGEFITEADQAATRLWESFGGRLPRIAESSRRQMKDVEFAANLLLLLEKGPESYSQTELDAAFAERDSEWDTREEIRTLFNRTTSLLEKILEQDEFDAGSSRYQNQADFYSLFGALASMLKNDEQPDPKASARVLSDFSTRANDTDNHSNDPDAKSYYEDARSASNDKGPRTRRIEAIKKVLQGAIQ